MVYRMKKVEGKILDRIHPCFQVRVSSTCRISGGIFCSLASLGYGSRDILYCTNYTAAQ